MRAFDDADAAFLALESGNSHLHVGAVVVVGPPEGKRSLFSESSRIAHLRRLVERRLDLVPALRRRAVKMPLGLSAPVWVDDADFDLDEHVRRTRLASPGSRSELAELVADVMSRPLDPDHPLWELTIVEGLAGGGVAVIGKAHHSLVDGIAGTSLLQTFLDLEPRPPSVGFPDALWEAEPAPSAQDLVAHAVAEVGRTPRRLLGALSRGLDTAIDVAEHNRELAALGLSPPPAPFSAPRTSLNGPLSRARSFSVADLSAADIRQVRRAFGVSRNEVILSSVGGALRRYFEDKGEDPIEALVGMVPVSTRIRREAKTGNEVSWMLVSMATHLEDPVERLRAVSLGSRIAREQERLTRGGVLEEFLRAATPAVSSRLLRLVGGLGLYERLRPIFNVTVSSVPGPEFELWCAGGRVEAMYPVGPVVEGVGLNVTSLSYRGRFGFGVLGCRRRAGDLQALTSGLAGELDDLVQAAGGEKTAGAVG